MKKNKYDKIYRFLIYFISAVVTLGILVTTISNQKFILEVGEIAPMDIKARVDVIDKYTTETLREDAVNAVQKQYKKDAEVKSNSIKMNNDFFNRIINYKKSEMDDEALIDYLTKNDEYDISSKGYEALVALNNDELRYILSTINNEINKTYDSPLEEDDPTKIEREKENLQDIVSSFNISDNAKDAVGIFSENLIKPNYFYDEEKTIALEKEAADSITPIIIKKNQLIVKEGEPVSNSQYELLDELGYLSSGKSNPMPYVGIGALIVIIYGIIYYYLKKFYNDLYYNNKKVLLIFLLVNASLGLTRIMVLVHPYFIPIAFLSLLLTILIKSKVAQTISIFNTIFMAIIVGLDVQVIVMLSILSILSIIFLKKVEERNDIIVTSFYVGLAGFFMTLSLGFLSSSALIENFKDSIFILLGALVSGVVVIGILPIIENSFNIVTNIKLLELSNPNSELLKKLQMEAPGTYHHSIMVGNLAESAAEVVGANSILLRVSAYYHDIGKLARPEFFKENQLTSKNPHDEISPNLSTLIIINHVKIGLEMAEEHNLPGEIRDMIAQHHGTTLVKYFYITMKNDETNDLPVLEEDFRYPGPKPQTKEAGIMMLADSVEAAVRSLKDPTPRKVDEMVYNIFADKLDDGQLDECNLTFKDVVAIRESFLKTFGSIYHARIEYPKEKKKNQAKKS
ncbi:MAG: HDIG domain-containing protein [Clostridium sp.]|nr:HDIG domain-containing protein [Clostridium sp.]